MPQKGSGPQFSKPGPTTKMTLQVDSSKFFHFESIEIDDNNIMIQFESTIQV
jgi:hypothetical protein